MIVYIKKKCPGYINAENENNISINYLIVSALSSIRVSESQHCTSAKTLSFRFVKSRYWVLGKIFDGNVVLAFFMTEHSNYIAILRIIILFWVKTKYISSFPNKIAVHNFQYFSISQIIY